MAEESGADQTVTEDPLEPVAVIVVYRDRPDVLAATVNAYANQSVPTRVMVVDNGSLCRASDALAPLNTPIEVVGAAHNLGFGPAANLGLRRWLRSSRGEWAVVTPHDAQPDRDVIEKMLEAASTTPSVGLMSADVGDGARPLIQPYLGPIEAETFVDAGFESSDYPHGTLLMASRSCLTEIGLFDERYFAYSEEAELGLRARDHGWEVGVVRGAMVHNPGMSANIERVAYLQHRNTLMMLRENFGRRQSAFRIAVAVLQIPIGMVYPPARGLHWSPRGRLLGIRDHLRRRYGAPPMAMRRRGGEYLSSDVSGVGAQPCS